VASLVERHRWFPRGTIRRRGRVPRPEGPRSDSLRPEARRALGSADAKGPDGEKASAGSPEGNRPRGEDPHRSRRQDLRVRAETTVDGPGTTDGESGNDRRATTAAMRHGYRRGESFEGYEPHREDGRRDPGPSGPRLGSPKHGEPHGRQQGATNLRRPSGASRQSGEKPQRRNGTGRVATSGRRMPETAPGSGRSVACRMRGASGRIPGEDGPGQAW
jgi:hypothetical protein